MTTDNDDKHAGTAEFKTVKAGCGFRFDPEALNEESGFDFSQAEELKDEAEGDQSKNAPKSETPLLKRHV